VVFLKDQPMELITILYSLLVMTLLDVAIYGIQKLTAIQKEKIVTPMYTELSDLDTI